MVVLIKAGPRFLSQETTRTSVRSARVDKARVWNGRRLVVFGRFTFIVRRICRRKFARRSRIVSGMSHGLGSHVDTTGILLSYFFSSGSGRPEKYTLVYKSFWKRLNEDVGLRFGRRGVGINLSPRPMMVESVFGMCVSLVVRSCISMFDGRVR